VKRRVIKKFHPPGTSPGTVSLPGAAAVAVDLPLICYGPDFVKEHRVRSLADLGKLAPKGVQAWLRVVGHQPQVLGELATHLGVHPLVLEDVVNVGQRPKVEDYESYLFIVVDLLRRSANGEFEEEQISLLLFDNLLVTIQERESDVFKLVDERLRAERGKMRKMAADYLAYALIDAAVDHYFPVLERVGERIEEIEDSLLDHAGRSALGELHGLKRDLLRLRKATWPLREMVGALARTESALVREPTRVWVRDVYDHTVQIIDIVETFREMTAGMLDLYLSSVSNRMNEVMKLLTVISTIFIPLTFIVGIYGMNFDTSKGPLNMPELGWAWGYPAIMLLMAVIAGGMVVMFRRRHWL
jgi:magnesium transporter